MRIVVATFNGFFLREILLSRFFIPITKIEIFLLVSRKERVSNRISVVDFFIEENIVNEKSIEGLFSFNERGEFIRLINYISINDVSLLTLDVEVVPTFNALS